MSNVCTAAAFQFTKLNLCRQNTSENEIKTQSGECCLNNITTKKYLFGIFVTKYFTFCKIVVSVVINVCSFEF